MLGIIIRYRYSGALLLFLAASWAPLTLEPFSPLHGDSKMVRHFMKVSIVAEKFTKMLEMRETKIEQIIILDDPSFYIIAYYSAIIDPAIKCLTNLESPWMGLQGFGVIWAPEAT